MKTATPNQAVSASIAAVATVPTAPIVHQPLSPPPALLPFLLRPLVPPRRRLQLPQLAQPLQLLQCSRIPDSFNAAKRAKPEPDVAPDVNPLWSVGWSMTQLRPVTNLFSALPSQARLTIGAYRP